MKSTPPPRLVAIDSQVLVWGIRKEGQESQKKRAKWLFEALQKEEAQIIVPAVAMSEYLTKVHPDQQKDVLTALARSFIIAPFDVRCAALAARLFSTGRGTIARKTQGARATLRADSLIIATAVVHGATTFYSGDNGCRKLASLAQGLQVLDLPTQPQSLFDY